MHAFVQGAGEHRVRDDDIEALEAGNASQQIPVGRTNTVLFEGVIGHRENDVPIRSRRRFGYQPRSQHVLVVATLRRAALEVAKRGDQESCLPHEPLGAAVVRSPRLEHTQGATLEVIDAVLTPPELVVQTKNLGDETGPQLERRLRALLVREATGHAKEYFSLSRREHRA